MEMKTKLVTLSATILLGGNAVLQAQGLAFTNLSPSALSPITAYAGDSWNKGGLAKVENPDPATTNASGINYGINDSLTMWQGQQDTNPTTYSSSDSWWRNPNDLYRAGEVDLQGFGFGTVNEHVLDHFTGRRIREHAELGAGGDLEFFPLKYVGLEGEGFSETTHHSFVNDAGGNLVLRLPIGNIGLAPYIYGGGGHEFYPENVGYIDGGGGLEYRFTRWFGIFADARYVATRRTGNYGMGRLGVTFSF